MDEHRAPRAPIICLFLIPTIKIGPNCETGQLASFYLLLLKSLFSVVEKPQNRPVLWSSIESLHTMLAGDVIFKLSSFSQVFGKAQIRWDHTWIFSFLHAEASLASSTFPWQSVTWSVGQLIGDTFRINSVTYFLKGMTKSFLILMGWWW